MTPTILLARDRKTGRDVILAGRDTPFPAQNAAYLKVHPIVNDEYDLVGLFELVPVKKPHRLVTTAEFEAQNAAAKAAAAAAAPAKPAAPKPSAPPVLPKKKGGAA